MLLSNTLTPVMLGSVPVKPSYVTCQGSVFGVAAPSMVSIPFHVAALAAVPRLVLHDGLSTVALVMKPSRALRLFTIVL